MPEKEISISLAEKLCSFMYLMSNLEKLPRMGYLLNGISKPESVAEHCFSMAILTMLLADEHPEVDTLKAIKMALLHEVSEIYLTDLPLRAVYYLGKDVKSKAETRIAREILGELGEDYIELWEEFEIGNTAEARLVRAVDKLQMMIKVAQYQSEKQGNLDGFWKSPQNFRDFGYLKIEQIFEYLKKQNNKEDKGKLSNFFKQFF